MELPGHRASLYCLIHRLRARHRFFIQTLSLAAKIWGHRGMGPVVYILRKYAASPGVITPTTYRIDSCEYNAGPQSGIDVHSEKCHLFGTNQQMWRNRLLPSFLLKLLFKFFIIEEFGVGIVGHYGIIVQL